MSGRTGTAALRRALEDAGRVVACEACLYGAARYTREDDKPVWTGLHIAHVVPVAADGPDDVGNLVILCRPCHESAPNTTSPDAFFSWLERRQASGDGPGMTGLRLLAEFLGDPQSLETFSHLPPEAVEDIARQAVREAGASLRPTVHFGQGGWNYETTRAVMAEAIRRAQARAAAPTASPAIAQESP
ncbi:HNH endonuclease signature motif containing protein [Streptomyces griseorubiginosus]|uniref:HNH endonuclease signature motif containing protein n=1 Tax=Streptomyces griseorubiginosus TaxID=67304 RepID=UPI0036E4CE10